MSSAIQMPASLWKIGVGVNDNVIVWCVYEYSKLAF